MKTVCPQCRTDGHHKMSCTDESNPARKDRVTVPTSLKEPIVEGAYYLCENGDVHRAGGYARGWDYLHDGQATWWGTIQSHIKLVRQVHLIPTDPAEVVAELRRRSAECEPPGEEVYGEEDNFQSGRSIGFDDSADLVESMLGLARCGEGCDGNCELTALGPTKAEVELAELRKRISELETAAREAVEEMRRRAAIHDEKNSGPLKDGYTWAYELSADLVAVKLGVNESARIVVKKLGVKL